MVIKLGTVKSATLQNKLVPAQIKRGFVPVYEGPEFTVGYYDEKKKEA